MTPRTSFEGVLAYRPLDRTHLVLALAQLREQWQEATEGTSLLKVQAPVGLLLNDIADLLELTHQERHVFLGERLLYEVATKRGERIARKQIQ